MIRSRYIVINLFFAIFICLTIFILYISIFEKKTYSIKTNIDLNNKKFFKNLNLPTYCNLYFNYDNEILKNFNNKNAQIIQLVKNKNVIKKYSYNWDKKENIDLFEFNKYFLFLNKNNFKEINDIISLNLKHEISIRNFLISTQYNVFSFRLKKKLSEYQKSEMKYINEDLYFDFFRNKFNFIFISLFLDHDLSYTLEEKRSINYTLQNKQAPVISDKIENLIIPYSNTHNLLYQSRLYDKCYNTYYELREPNYISKRIVIFISLIFTYYFFIYLILNSFFHKIKSSFK